MLDYSDLKKANEESRDIDIKAESWDSFKLLEIYETYYKASFSLETNS